jgi:hypothetical protein
MTETGDRVLDATSRSEVGVVLEAVATTGSVRWFRARFISRSQPMVFAPPTARARPNR